MILQSLSSAWAALALPAANHLWQSTLFALIVGVVILTMRGHQARIRYGLWLAASLKFLVPFSLLVDLGSHWATSSVQVVIPAPLYMTMEQVGRPFGEASAAVAAAPMPAPVSPTLMHLFPAFLLAVWVCGCAAVLFTWGARWWRISRSLRQVRPLQEGRELEMLRRLERAAGLRRPMELFLSPSSLEPGIFRIAHPLLILPEGICEKLDDARFECVLAHEICHARRHDNLAAALHMLVEALFWFHPLVWWMGHRLIEERERACDEAVIAGGRDRTVYAGALLGVCKFYLGSPLDCAAGVSGANLRKRIERVMTSRKILEMRITGKALLTAAAAAAILGPIAVGSALGTRTALQAPLEPYHGPGFQSFTIRVSQPGDFRSNLNIRPNRFWIENFSLRRTIAWAYGTQTALVSGPKSLDTHYNIYAKAPGAFRKFGYATDDQAGAMVRKVLRERFHLDVHHTKQSLPAYVLTQEPGGARLITARPGEPGPAGDVGPTHLLMRGVRMIDLVQRLSNRLGRPVLDETGLTKTYDYGLHWKGIPSASAAAGRKPAAGSSPSDSAAILDALHTQLGLRARLEKRPVEVLVVDRVESPEGLLPAFKAASMDPHGLDRYVGHYEFPGHWIMTAYRKGAHFWAQLQGQPPVEFFPTGHNEFFAKVVDAQISFEADAQGRTTELVLHQNCRDTHAPRMKEVRAEEMLEAVQARIKKNTPQKGSEQALRQLLQELASGNPDYDRMSLMEAQICREYLARNQAFVTSFGPLISLKFMGVDGRGADKYKAQYKHESMGWIINMAPDGKIAWWEVVLTYLSPPASWTNPSVASRTKASDD